MAKSNPRLSNGPTNVIGIGDLRNMGASAMRDLVEPLIIIDGNKKDRLAALVPYEQWQQWQELKAAAAAALERRGLL